MDDAGRYLGAANVLFRPQGRSEITGEGLYPERRAQDIEELLKHLNAGPAVLVGWSLAVQELLAYVEHYGTGRVEALVFVDGPVKTDGTRSQVTWSRILHEIQRDRRHLTERMVRGMYSKPQDEDYIKRMVEASLRTPTSAAFTLIGEFTVMDADLSVALNAVDVPVLCVVTPGLNEEAAIVSSRVRGARVEVFEGAGHALFVDEAERFNSLLEEFLRRR